MSVPITIISSPNQISSAYNQIIYKISSSDTAQPNFNFVADVYVSGFTGIQARLLYPVQPNTNILQFDIGNVLKNYVSYDFLDSFGTLVQANWQSTANYYVQFGEIYDVSGITGWAPTLYANIVRNPTSNYKSAINTVFDFQQMSTNILDTYDVSAGNLLNTDSVQKMRVSDNKLISFLDKNRIVTHVMLMYLSSSNSWLNPSAVKFAITLPTGFNIFNIDIQKVIAHYGAPPAGTASMLFQLIQGTTVLTNTILTIDDSCSQYDTMRLHWLNQLGGFDTFNFNKATTTNVDITRSQFKTIQALNNAHSDRLKTNYNTEMVDKINLQSDWITDDESGLIQTLIESPIVFLENADGSFVAVNITNPSYEVKKYLNGRKIFNVSIDMEYTYNRYRQSQ